MKDNMKELCMNKRIKPVYTGNKLTILSNGSQNGIPVLRIHKIFKNCSRKTAQAVVNYYLDPENRENYIRQIKTHIKKYPGVSEYKIAPLGDNFINAFILNNFGEGKHDDFSSALTEYSISSLIQKDLSGTHSMKINNGVIEVEDNIIELDIVLEK